MKEYFRIHEVETNVTYDDRYDSIEEAERQIEEYERQDADPEDPRSERVTYKVVEVSDE